MIGCVTALIGILGLSAGVQGYLASDLNIVERLLLLCVPFLIIYPTLTSNLIGVAIIAAIYIMQKINLKKKGLSGEGGIV